MSWKDRIKSWIQIRNPLTKRKQLTSSENQENYQGLSTIDTTFITLPKEKELSSNDIKKINEYEKEIQLEKQDSLIFYGNTLLSYSSKNADLLLRLFDSVREKALEWQVRDLDVEELLQKRINTLINYEELEVCQTGLKELKKEAILRALAIERVQKKQEKKNLKIFSIFRLAEKMKEDMQTNSLKEAKERLLIAIKTIDQQIDIAERMIQEEIDLEYSLRIYHQVASELENEKCKNTNKFAWRKKQQELLKRAEDVGINVEDIEFLNEPIIFCDLNLEEEQNQAREFALLQRKIDIKAIELKRKIPSILNRMQEIEKTPKTKENIYELMKELHTHREIYLEWQRLDRFGGMKKDRDEDVYYQAFYEVIFWAKAKDLDNFVHCDYVSGYVNIYSFDKPDFYMKVGLEEISNIYRAYDMQYDKYRETTLSSWVVEQINRYERFLNNKLQQIAQKQGITSFTKQEIEIIRRGTLKQMKRRLIGVDTAIKSVLIEQQKNDTDLPMLELLYDLCEKDVKDMKIFKLCFKNWLQKGNRYFSKTISPFKVSKQELTRISSFSYQERLSIQDLEEIFEFLEIQEKVQYTGDDGLLKIADRIYHEREENRQEKAEKSSTKIIFPQGITAINIFKVGDGTVKYPSKFYSNVNEVYLHPKFNVQSFYKFLKEIKNEWHPKAGICLKKLEKVHLPKQYSDWEKLFQMELETRNENGLEI